MWKRKQKNKGIQVLNDNKKEEKVETFLFFFLIELFFVFFSNHYAVSYYSNWLYLFKVILGFTKDNTKKDNTN